MSNGRNKYQFGARSEILERARILSKFDLLGRSAKAVSQDFTPSEQVSLFFELSGGVEADTQAIRVRPEVKIEAGWPHEGWTDRPVARLQAGQMGRNGSRTVTRLAVIPECSTSSRQSSAWPAQLREQGR
jgi:hypothetical protein